MNKRASGRYYYYLGNSNTNSLLKALLMHRQVSLIQLLPVNVSTQLKDYKLSQPLEDNKIAMKTDQNMHSFSRQNGQI